MSTTTAIPPKSERARLLALVKRKPGISKEDFCEYWWKTHAPMLLGIMPEPGYLKVDQMHINDEINAQFAELGAKTTSEWDGAAVIEAASWDDIFKIMGDEEYLKARKEDEAKFVDADATLLIPVVNINFINN
ncbi:hypothetical protein CYLTODRAFT_486507 [Cylindrobasidium torrendii FP15055 ss-10]|uniref:EthD domain-containing protein n=1 Tax=Cylindrobasidium torrendii FP15055 ss-10 TaxID=1314674 RepID=A0A0D7BQ54_9AGAR|nr:hypothetical protein CYLTODRAFT_486507 [Cylindrobasidium torrendii FP15055 ss-10]